MKCFSYMYVRMAVLYENVINFIIFEKLNVRFSNISLKKYHSTMKCGLDKKNELKGDYHCYHCCLLTNHQKFIYSVNATKFCKISTNYLTGSILGQKICGDFVKLCGLLRIYLL